MIDVFGPPTVGMLLLICPAIVEMIRRIIAKEPFLYTLLGLLVGFILGGMFHVYEVYVAGEFIDFAVAFESVLYGLMLGATIGGLISGGTAVRDRVQFNRQMRQMQGGIEDNGFPR